MSGSVAYLTGGTGFIGLHLARLLIDEGWHVVALHRPGADVDALGALGVDLAEGNLNDAASIMNTVPDTPDAIFHVAGNVSFDSAGDAAQNNDNVDGTHNLLAVAQARNCRRFVYTSTGATFGLPDGWVTEDTPSNAMEVPINYFRTKTLAENAVLEAAADGLDVVILNPANVVGPGDRVIWTPFVRAIKSGALTGVGHGTGSFCHIDEVVRAHLAAYERGQGGHRYILAGDVARFVDLAALVARLTNGHAPPVTDAAPEGMSPETFELMSHVQLLDCSKAERELGFRPVGVGKMFEDLVIWLQQKDLDS
jgi:dihydroflavonol-4-reductase